MKKIIYLFALFGCMQIVMAQQDSSYLPLAVGNYWQFEPNYPHTVHAPKYTVTRDTMILGKQYFFIEEDSVRNYGQSYPWPTIAPLRQDEKGDIFAYIISENRECLQYRFSEWGRYSSCWGEVQNRGDVDGMRTSIIIGGEVGTDFYRGVGPISFGSHEYWYKLSRAIINNICVTCNPQVGVEQGKSVPETIKLYQNYPNPFNPSTKIKYSLDKSGFVKIKIYDLLGREMATLVSENKKPGSYEATFNANSTDKTLTSGVYFYKLHVNNFTECKKMVFAK